MNIIAVIEGNESQLKAECIVIGALMPTRKAKLDNIHLSSNDIISSASTVIELANIYVQNNIKPKRSILFALYSPEEQVQFNSKLFASQLPVSIEQVVAIFNIDGVEISKRNKIDNRKGASKIWHLTKKTDSQYAKILVEPTLCGNNCNTAINNIESTKSIPCFNFLLSNSYEHLHYLSDTYDSLNTICFKKISQLAFLFSLQMVNAYFSKDIMLQ